MKMKFFALLIVWAFALNGFAIVTNVAAQTGGKKVGQDTALVGHLPASDGVLALDMQRLLSYALPQILSGSQPMLADILSHIDEVKVKTGVDLRQFEQIAVGVSSKKTAARELEFEPIVLARGTFNHDELLRIIKNAVGGKSREEKIGQQTIYIFTPTQKIKTAPMPSTKSGGKTSSTFERAMEKMFDGLTREFAVSPNFDGNILAIGSVARLRETFAFTPREGNATAMYASPRISQEMLGLVNRKPNSLVSFSLKLPEGMSSFIELGDDEIGKNLDAIRYLAGAFDAADGNVTISLLAKTAQAEQAKILHEQLETLQMVGKTLLGGAKGADKQIYARMLENVKIARNLTDITLDLQVPQSDINTLLNKKTAPKTEASLSK